MLCEKIELELETNEIVLCIDCTVTSLEDFVNFIHWNLIRWIPL